ncbi:MAG: GntR family transcriptional regulator [Angelakisella sp.]
MGDKIPNSTQDIFERLKGEILNLELKPGQAMGENELCGRFHVSRTPIRTVLRRLEGCGLVEIVPYKGTYVSLLNYDEILQMIYLRTAVESKVIRDFIDIVTPIILEKIRYIIRKQTVLTSGNFSHDDFYLLDGQLHEIWFKETKKMHLWNLIQQAQVQYTRFRMLDITTALAYPQIIAEHSKLFALMEAGNKAAVEPLMQQHLNGGIERLQARICTDFSDYFIQEQQ